MSKRGHGETCYWCKRPLEATGSRSTRAATKDHVHPKSLGGRTKVWCCVACNNLKGDMLPSAWAEFMAANPEWWKLRRRPKRRGYKLKTFDDVDDFYRQHGGVIPPHQGDLLGTEPTVCHEIVDAAVALFRNRCGGKPRHLGDPATVGLMPSGRRHRLGLTPASEVSHPSSSGRTPHFDCGNRGSNP